MVNSIDKIQSNSNRNYYLQFITVYRCYLPIQISVEVKKYVLLKMYTQFNFFMNVNQY